MKPLERLLELIEDWKMLVGRDGFFRTLPIVIREAAEIPYRHLRFTIIARVLSKPLPYSNPNIDLEIRPFRQSDVQAVRGMDRPSEAKLCERRLQLGHQGLVACHLGKPIGYAWGCAEVNPLVERVSIPLEPGDFLCTDVYTAPAFRGNGVQTALSRARFQLFRDLGFCRAICYIEEQNLPSLAVWQRKLDGEIIGKIDFVRFFSSYRVKIEKR